MSIGSIRAVVSISSSIRVFLDTCFRIAVGILIELTAKDPHFHVQQGFLCLLQHCTGLFVLAFSPHLSQ